MLHPSYGEREPRRSIKCGHCWEPINSEEFPYQVHGALSQTYLCQSCHDDPSMMSGISERYRLDRSRHTASELGAANPVALSRDSIDSACRSVKDLAALAKGQLVVWPSLVAGFGYIAIGLDIESLRMRLDTEASIRTFGAIVLVAGAGLIADALNCYRNQARQKLPRTT